MKYDIIDTIVMTCLTLLFVVSILLFANRDFLLAGIFTMIDILACLKYLTSITNRNKK